MDLKELKKVWSQVSLDTATRRELTESRISEILSLRTTSLMERIDKNIRRGLIILFLVIAGFYLWDFLLSGGKETRNELYDNIPGWLWILDHGINSFVLILFTLFFVSYTKVRRQCSIHCDLKQTLQKIIRILSVYRRLFILALFIFLLTFAAGFMKGFYDGVAFENGAKGFFTVDLVIGMVTLVLLSTFLYLLLKWIFRRLYGNYLQQLRATLKELEELT
jgi:hypothetical protein